MMFKTTRYFPLWLGRLTLFLSILLIWHILSSHPTLAFFLGEPKAVGIILWQWFTQNPSILDVTLGERLLTTFSFPAQIYPHLIITLLETGLAFILGTLLGMICGLYLGIHPTLSDLFSPYIKAMNAVPRIILAPIFAMWFGLGITSKIAFAMTLVFFVVFFNVYHGIHQINPACLANIRLLGANKRWQLKTLYLPAAMAWVFSSLHIAVGLAFVGAVVGEYLGSSRGIGYLILQAEGNFDINTILAGTLVLTFFALLLDTLLGIIEKRVKKYAAFSTFT